MFGGAELWLALVALVTAICAAAFAAGRRSKDSKDLKGEVKTHERINDAEISPDADAAREWLRKRKR